MQFTGEKSVKLSALCLLHTWPLLRSSKNKITGRYQDTILRYQKKKHLYFIKCKILLQNCRDIYCDMILYTSFYVLDFDPWRPDRLVVSKRR